jgi:hypothetical protein
MWVIQVAPSPGETTLLQAEMAGGTYVLCFTTDEKARAVIASLGVEGAWSARVPVNADDAPSLVSAVCQVGAIGIIVDLDPATRRCAWSRRLIVTA